MSKPERYTFDDPTGYQGADFDYYDADETDKWVAELEAENRELKATAVYREHLKVLAENRELRRADTAWQYSDIGKLKARLTEAERVIQNLVDGFGGVAEEEDLREARAFLNQKEDTYDSQPSPPWPKKEDTHE